MSGTPRPFARIGAALLLEGGVEARALVDGAPARALVFTADPDEGRAIGGAALAIARETKGAAMCGVHLAAVAHDDTVVIVLDDPGGVDLTSVLRRHAGRGDFPWDVACRIGLDIAALSTWAPPIANLVVGWDGRLRASPVPRAGTLLRSGAGADVRFLSPEEVRGERVRHDAVAAYRAGAVVYELLGGAPPFAVDPVQSALPTVLMAIIGDERVPLARRLHAARPRSVDDALVDAMVKPHLRDRVDVAVATRALASHACGGDDAARFLAGFLADAFPDERARAAAWWEQAATLTASDAPAWPFVEVAPVAEVDAALRALNNRHARTD